jgi:hypothetical protein
MQFQPNPSSVLGEWRGVCDPYMFHTYEFYVKPAGEHKVPEQIREEHDGKDNLANMILYPYWNSR